MASFGTPVLAVVGAGFLGQEVLRQASRAGWRLDPVVRSETSAAKLQSEFGVGRAADASQAEFWRCCSPGWDALVWAAAPSRFFSGESFETLQQCGARQAANWVALNRIPFVYISSTSVYAENSGGWVNEDDPLAMGEPRVQALVAAERACLGVGGVVLRCAGLYGKERAFKEPGEGPERWVNLVHVEAAARAVAFALRQKGGIFNVCEEEPRRRGRPGGAEAPAQSRTRRNKRVSNARLCSLGWLPFQVGAAESGKPGSKIPAA